VSLILNIGFLCAIYPEWLAFSFSKNVTSLFLFHSPKEKSEQCPLGKDPAAQSNPNNDE
jgi:hypothetical protein